MPDSTKHRAVFAFITTQLGRMFLRTGISNIQPTSTRQPTRVTIALAAFGTDLSVEIRRESGSWELFTFNIICREFPY
jgi:hypothetical protein